MPRRSKAPIPLPPDVERYLVSSLRSHRFFSLRMRAQLVKDRFGFYMSHKRLRRWYLNRGIRNQRCPQILRPALEHPDRRRDERVTFTMRLVSLIMQQKPVIFFDEASWKLWNIKDLKKTWMTDDKKIPIVKNSKGLKSVTFYGAVSNIFNTVQLMTF